MRFLAIIPARYASTRFPGKPLVNLQGEPIIKRVYERVASVFENVCVATDDERILSRVREFGGNAVMTSEHHKSGTDRCYEAFLHNGGEYDVVVNVQGDEPFVAREQLEMIKRCFSDESVDIATLVKPFPNDTSWETLSNPNTPKVVLDNNFFAMYFSRSVIPYQRGENPDKWASKHQYFKHIGLYAYRTDVLCKITSLPQSFLETAESLEQLRWLQEGYKIKVGITDIETIGIDTPEDLRRAEEFLLALQKND